MWTDNTRNAKIRRGSQIEVFKIVNGYENIDCNILFEIKKCKMTRGHNFTLVKKHKIREGYTYSSMNRLSISK